MNEEIDDPITGEIIDLNSIDQMIDRYEAIKETNERLYGVLSVLRRAIADKTSGDAVTRRVAGSRRLAKVVMPDETFDQTELKRLWDMFPGLAAEYLKIGTIAVKKVEYKKLLNTSSDQSEFPSFREALIKANNGRTGTPRIEIER